MFQRVCGILQKFILVICVIAIVILTIALTSITKKFYSIQTRLDASICSNLTITSSKLDEYCFGGKIDSLHEANEALGVTIQLIDVCFDYDNSINATQKASINFLKSAHEYTTRCYNGFSPIDHYKLQSIADVLQQPDDPEENKNWGATLIKIYWNLQSTDLPRSWWMLHQIIEN